ncbi:MAG: minor capsid protein, partial [Defluviitaleaceae bacterium]|nr:minor capsid protein [Defluviitaleaceae bacterium]
VASNFARLNRREIDAVLSKPWASDGADFSERIWRDRDALVNYLHTGLSQTLIQGKSPDKLIDDVKTRFGVSRSNAGRIVMTESAHFANQAAMDSYDELGVKQYQLTVSLDEVTCAVCGGMDGQVFSRAGEEPGVNAPPLHPNCRCTTIPYFEDEDGERAARNADGEHITVPGDMTYKQWKEKYLDNAKAAEPPKAETPKTELPTADKNDIIISGGGGMISGATPEHDSVYLPDIQIFQSLGAKARNYDILLPDNEIVNLSEGTKITNVEVIAGKGKNRKIDEVDRLVRSFGGNPDEWQKVKGIGFVDYGGESLKAELHWYQEPSVGKVLWKLKVQQGGEYFIE